MPCLDLNPTSQIKGDGLEHFEEVHLATCFFPTWNEMENVPCGTAVSEIFQLRSDKRSQLTGELPGCPPNSEAPGLAPPRTACCGSQATLLP